MRTTLTLDDDVSAELKHEMRKTGQSFKATVNDLLRLGLNARLGMKEPGFVVRAKPMGPPPGLTYDSVEELLDHLDGPLRR